MRRLDPLDGMPAALVKAMAVRHDGDPHELAKLYGVTPWIIANNRPAPAITNGNGAKTTSTKPRKHPPRRRRFAGPGDLGRLQREPIPDYFRTSDHDLGRVLAARGVGLRTLAKMTSKTEEYCAAVINGDLPVSADFRNRITRKLGMPANQLFGTRPASSKIDPANIIMEGPVPTIDRFMLDDRGVVWETMDLYEDGDTHYQRYVLEC
jgi:hypothetical protein